MQPALFISHGAPTLPFEDVPAREFLMALGRSLTRPAAILVVSAHWETAVPTVNAVAANETIHDFRGFPAALYQMRYPAAGTPDLAVRITDLLGEQGLRAQIDPARGLDHGAWVPLALMFPAHDIPVLQLSIQSQLGPGHHIQLGRALASLRAENVLILASGSMTHNLRELNVATPDRAPDWVAEFADWFDDRLGQGRTCELASYRKLAPHAERNHPTEEHILPLFVALGAAGPDARSQLLHTSTTYGVLRMDAFAFHAATDSETTLSHQLKDAAA